MRLAVRVLGYSSVETVLSSLRRIWPNDDGESRGLDARLRLIWCLPYLVTGCHGPTNFDLLLDDRYWMKNEGENTLSVLCQRCRCHILTYSVVKCATKARHIHGRETKTRKPPVVLNPEQTR
jgi:hypothetical protein